MARSTTFNPEGAPPLEPPTPAEEERRAAGDIAEYDSPLFAAYRWSIWRKRLPHEVTGGGDQWGQVLVHYGQLNEEWLRDNLGGGTFELRGYYDAQDGKGRTLKRRPVVTIEAPRKDFAALPTPQGHGITPMPNGAQRPPEGYGVTQPGSLSPSERYILRRLRKQERVLERLMDRLTATPAAAPATATPLGELANVFVALHSIAQQKGKDPTDLEVMKLVTNVMSQGIEIGMQRDPTPGEPSDPWITIADKAMPAIERIITTIAARRGRPVSGAEVVTPGAQPAGAAATSAPAAQPAWDINKVREAALMDALSRAIVRGDTPEEFAGSIEGWPGMTDDDLHNLRVAPDAVIIGTVQGYGQAAETGGPAGEVFKPLAHASVPGYVQRVLAALRREDAPADGADVETDPTDDGDGDPTE